MIRSGKDGYNTFFWFYIKVVSIAPLFAEAIKRINEGKPLGDLFMYEK